MKKIFAIALALVMVLSMASAFASECNVGPYDWSCSTSTTNCAKATVEVIPYVTTNAACNDLSYVESDCAAAINGENVYFALKVTVPADIDREWLDTAEFELTVKGMQSVNGKAKMDDGSGKDVKFVDGYEGSIQLTTASVDALLNEDEGEDGWVYYYKLDGSGTGAWHEATEDSDFDVADVMNKAVVNEYAKAKVCFTLKSENKFTSATVGDYVVTYSTSARHLTVDGVTYEAVLKFASEDGSVYLYMDEDDKVQKIVTKDVAACTTDAALINDVLASYNLGCGYGLCITEDAVKANFGWKDKVESCFSWKTENAMAVVDSECVVAIPKTGDASVLAWLF